MHRACVKMTSRVGKHESSYKATGPILILRNIIKFLFVRVPVFIYVYKCAKRPELKHGAGYECILQRNLPIMLR